MAIGTWPTPELPHVGPLDKKDKLLLADLHAVFLKYGLKGKIVKLEFDRGTPYPIPPKTPRGIRMGVSGTEGRPYYTWMCL